MPLPPFQYQRLAVLIDAENASSKWIEPLLNQVAGYGTTTIKRIYGDWTKPDLASWKNCLNKYAIQPIQQFRYTIGKNSSDSALIIDAMDLLHSGHVDGYCLVSSDSDFTRLACRIRESGLTVYGFGKKQTPEPFVRACDCFIYVETLPLRSESEAAISVKLKPVDIQVAAEHVSIATTGQPIEFKQIEVIHSAYVALAPEGGWVHLGALGNQILKLWPSFDPRKHGFSNLTKLITSLGNFKIENRNVEGKVGIKNPYIIRISNYDYK